MATFIDNFTRVCGSKTLASLIGINVTVFLLAWIVILSGDSMGMSGNFTMPWLCVSADPSVFLHHPWTAATYMVTHYDFLHLLFNMLWLYWFGVMFTPAAGDKNLIRLYIGGGLAGTVLYVAVTALWPSLSTPGAYLCGASASVLAIMTAVATISPDRRVYLFLIGPVRIKWIAIACIVLTFLGLGGGNPGAQSAHIGGVVFGVAFALWKKHRKPSKKDNRQRSTSSQPFQTTRQYTPGKATRVAINGDAVAKAVAGRLSDASRLDELLDKIRLSGYSSLTTGERNELNELSRRLDKTGNQR